MKKHLVSLRPGVTVYTHLGYSQDKKRRALNELRAHGYFVQEGRFTFVRTSQQKEDVSPQVKLNLPLTKSPNDENVSVIGDLPDPA